MTVKPLGDRIVVQYEEVQEKTASGIYIPQTAQEKTQIGIVQAVGDDETIKVSVGQKILFDKYAGTTIKNDGQEQLILRFSDVLAVIE